MKQYMLPETIVRKRGLREFVPLALLFPAALVGFVSLLEGASVAVPMLAVLLYMGGYAWVSSLAANAEERRLFIRFFSWAFVLRVVWGVTIYYWFMEVHGHPFATPLGLGADDSTYERHAQAMLQQWSIGIPEIRSHHPGYLYVLASLTWFGEFLGGYHLLQTRVFNAFIGAITVPYVYILARNTYGAKVARWAALLALLFPLFLYYSALQLRDIIIVFLVVYVVANASQFIVSRARRYLGWVLAGIVVLLLFRTVLAAVVLISIGFTIAGFVVFDKGDGRRKKMAVGTYIAALLVMVGALGYLAVEATNPRGDSLFLAHLDRDVVEDRMDRQTTRLMGAAPDGSLGGAIISRFPFPSNLLVTPLVGTIMPYPPWATLGYGESANNWVLFGNGFAYFLLFPLVLVGAAWSVRGTNWPSSIMVLVPWILVLMAATSVGFSNRYLLPAYPFALVLAAFAMVEARERRRRRDLKFLYVAIHAGTFTLYLGAKAVLG